MESGDKMELRDMEIFLTLAEELHFGRNVARLHVSPARVSQAIKKQERPSEPSSSSAPAATCG